MFISISNLRSKGCKIDQRQNQENTGGMLVNKIKETRKKIVKGEGLWHGSDLFRTNLNKHPRTIETISECFN
jgi:hypothetical protein